MDRAGCVVFIIVVVLSLLWFDSCREDKRKRDERREYAENVAKQRKEAQKRFKKEERELSKRSLLEWKEDEKSRHNDLYQRRRTQEFKKLPLSEWTSEEKNQNPVLYLEKLLVQYKQYKKQVEKTLDSQKSCIGKFQKSLKKARARAGALEDELKELAGVIKSSKEYPKKYPEKWHVLRKQIIFETEEELGWFVKGKLDELNTSKNTISESEKSLQALNEQLPLNKQRLSQIKQFILKLESALEHARIEQDVYKVNGILAKIDSEQSSITAIQNTSLSVFEAEHTTYKAQEVENKKVLEEVIRNY